MKARAERNGECVLNWEDQRMKTIKMIVFQKNE